MMSLRRGLNMCKNLMFTRPNRHTITTTKPTLLSITILLPVVTNPTTTMSTLKQNPIQRFGWHNATNTIQRSSLFYNTPKWSFSTTNKEGNVRGQNIKTDDNTNSNKEGGNSNKGNHQNGSGSDAKGSLGVVGAALIAFTSALTTCLILSHLHSQHLQTTLTTLLHHHQSSQHRILTALTLHNNKLSKQVNQLHSLYLYDFLLLLLCGIVIGLEIYFGLVNSWAMNGVSNNTERITEEIREIKTNLFREKLIK